MLSEITGVKYGEENSLAFQIFKQNEEPVCEYCGRKFSKNMDGYFNITLDHVISRQDGGEDEAKNIVIACRSCNSSKNKKSFVKNSQELVDFKALRKRIKELDDKWVINLFEFSTLDSFPKFTELQNELKIELEKQYKNVTLSKNKEYIEWETNYGCWTFSTSSYAIQPHYLFKLLFLNDNQKRKFKNDMTKDQLKNLIMHLFDIDYYATMNHCVVKYLKPFNKLSDGIELIKKEIEVIEGKPGFLEKYNILK